ncbi:MAG: acyltransferase family protein, partial [Janthinobacterium lividum]
MNERVKPRSTAFISDIEVLRACAVLLVIFAHTFFLFPWSNSYYNILATYIVGWPGVDLFFCISGYVIARDLLRSRAEAANTEGFLGWAVPF